MGLFGFIQGMLSPTHMIILLVIALLVFGHRLPSVARGMGQSIKEFKKGLKEGGEGGEGEEAGGQIERKR